MKKGIEDFTIFLHGPSGAGKGEIQRQLVNTYNEQGYQVGYISSGDLFREAYSDPDIAERSRRGEYLDTLGAIIPGLKNAYEIFLRTWRKNDGKAILILDGLIRRGEFKNKAGILVPSQIDQISTAFSEARTESKILSPTSPIAVSAEIKHSKHIIIEIAPQDAESQIKRRAQKELISIQQQLLERITSGTLAVENSTLFFAWLNEISTVVNSDLPDEKAYERLAAEAEEIRKKIASHAEKEGSASLASCFKALGFSTQLRDDDISPIGRRTRIASYVSSSLEHGNTQYIPGFVMKSLTEGLPYRFQKDGTVSSTEENCLVVRNGLSKEIGLETFQKECGEISRELETETEKTRESLFPTSGIERHRTTKER